MKRGMILIVGMLLLIGCEAVRAERLEGYWVNRNTVLFMTVKQSGLRRLTEFPKMRRITAVFTGSVIYVTANR